jgi:hypothetical protein
MIGKKVRTFALVRSGSRAPNVLSVHYLAFWAQPGLEIARGILHNTVAAASGNSGESAVAKSGGRLATTARLFVCVSLMTGALSAGPAVAQRLELRAGAVASSALVSDAIARGASTVQATARPAPLVGIVFLLPLRPAVSLEAGAAYAASNLRASDAGGSWGGEALGVWQALVGVRYRPGSRTRPD